MKVLLSPDMAKELLNNEEQIKNHQGMYRPQFRRTYMPQAGAFKSEYVPVIKCWPLEPFTGEFPQIREVIPGMEDEVFDISIATIDNGCFNGKKMLGYSIYIYAPGTTNPPYFLTDDSLPGLFDQMRDYQIGMNVDTSGVNDSNVKDMLKDVFRRYVGICTYVLFKGEDCQAAGEWRKQDVW